MLILASSQITPKSIILPMPSWDDDDAFGGGGRAVLPVADKVPEGDPVDGAEYLALVRAETRKLPVTVSRRKTTATSTTEGEEPTELSHPLYAHFDLAASTLLSDFQVACTTRPDLIPRAAWRSSFLSRFTGMRTSVARIRAERREKLALGLVLNDEPKKLPSAQDMKGWKRLLYPHEAEAPVVEPEGEELEENEEQEDEVLGEEIVIDDANGLEEGEEKEAMSEEGEAVEAPTEDAPFPAPVPDLAAERAAALAAENAAAKRRQLTLPARLNYTEVGLVLKHHINWMRHSNFIDLDRLVPQVRWVSSLLLNLDPDLLTGDQVSILRELSRTARLLRKRIGEMTLGPTDEEGRVPPETIPASHEAVAGLNMIIVAVAGGFGQVDLSDPSREHIATVSEPMREYLGKVGSEETGQSAGADGQGQAEEEESEEEGREAAEDEEGLDEEEEGGLEEDDDDTLFLQQQQASAPADQNSTLKHSLPDAETEQPERRKRKKRKTKPTVQFERHWDEPETPQFSTKPDPRSLKTYDDIDYD